MNLRGRGEALGKRRGEERLRSKRDTCSVLWENMSPHDSCLETTKVKLK